MYVHYIYSITINAKVTIHCQVHCAFFAMYVVCVFMYTLVKYMYILDFTATLSSSSSSSQNKEKHASIQPNQQNKSSSWIQDAIVNKVSVVYGMEAESVSNK